MASERKSKAVGETNDMLPLLRTADEIDIESLQRSYPLAVEYYLSGVALQYPDEADESPEDAVYYYKLAADLGHAGAQRAMAVCSKTGYGCEKNENASELWLGMAAMGGDAEAEYRLGLKLLAERNNKGNAKAIKNLKNAGKKKHSGALHRLGLYYSDLNENSRNTELAFDYFLKAANLGYSAAEFKVSNCLSEGIGTEKDPEGAAQWCQSAAMKGHRAAQYRLGCFLFEGDGVEHSYELAVYWFTRSSESGYALANMKLSDCFSRGRGVQKSAELAYAYCSVAANQGLPEAMYELGVMLHEGNGTSQRDEEARVWLTRATEQGVKEAKALLTELILRDHPDQWRNHYQAAAADGDVKAMLKLARAYATGSILGVNGDEAVRFYNAAVDERSVVACSELAKLYMQGYIIEKNLEKAEDCFKLAVFHGANHALVSLGDLVNDFSDDGFDNDDDGRLFVKKSSLYWWRRAAEHGQSEAYKRLADCYAKGLGVDADPVLAQQWEDEYKDKKKREELITRAIFGATE